MRLDVRFDDFGKLPALMRVVGPAGRRRLYEVGTYAAGDLVRRHLRTLSFQRHATAASLGASPTGHYDVSRHPVVQRVEGSDGIIEIRIPGIARARRDITLTTPTSRGKNYYTIPKHAAAYGKTVETLRRRGWKIFRPGDKKILLGYRHKGDKPVVLFALAETARLREDPSLLPTDRQIADAASSAMAGEVRRVLVKAGDSK